MYFVFFFEVDTNGLREASTSTMSSSSEEDQAPPVVILSGVNGKEVPGLVFGFEVNEQLLNEDVCETFKARYYMPEQYDSRHHDKIVNFIGLGEFYSGHTPKESYTSKICKEILLISRNLRIFQIVIQISDVRYF